MDDGTRFALNGINKRFYRECSKAFSDTRSRPWPGWFRVIARTPLERPSGLLGVSPVRILDVGCGNGRFAMFLEENLPVPFSYYGIDASSELLEIARANLEGCGIRELELEQAELVEVGLPEALENRHFDLIVLFGVLHHIPGLAERLLLLQNLTHHLSGQGILALSFWQFGSEPRFVRRALSWSDCVKDGDVEVDLDQLEQGDYLLAWGQSQSPGKGRERATCRYCHHACDLEIEQLLAQLDIEVEDSFRSDGAGNALNRYEILRSRA
jgi:tRNA (uracil-5-)-methyltransferase TRM9